MDLLSAVAHNMYLVIFVCGVAEGYLFYKIHEQCDRQSVRLLDVLENMLKVFPDKPDLDSEQPYHDRLSAILVFFENKVQVDRSSVQKIRASLHRLLEHNKVAHTYLIEQMYNIAAAVVQIFPLLGVLGTILGLGQVTIGSGGAIKASDVTTAFVGSIRSTILGVLFAIVFMFLEAHALAKVKRTIEETKSTLGLASSAIVA